MSTDVRFPKSYEGRDPFIYVSCHPADRERVLPILQRLDQRGVRFWYDEGIAPGMDGDEIIAEHIERCGFFIAFLSGNYLGSLDTVDELNYSRDVDKDYLLVYLEDLTLPAGLDMRFLRAQSVRAFAMEDEAVYAQIMSLDGVGSYYGIADASLRPKADQVFGQLEALYPEHKVFALDAVAHQLSKRLSELYVAAGYPSAERLLQDYGFERISTDEARRIRNSVLYLPGFEPDAIKPRIDYVVQTLSADYPDKVITDVLSKTHKAIYRSVQGLSVWMGYESAASLLNAYGFTGVTSDSGRAAIDHEAVLSQLTERYRGKPKPMTLMQLIQENQDMKGNLKTLSNRVAEIFGVTLLQHLKNIGLIVPKTPMEQSTATARVRAEIIRDMRGLYEQPGFDYGTFEDAAETLEQLVIKRRKAGRVCVYDCGACGETMRIPLGVDYIEAEAMSGQSDLVTLILPPTLTEIREAAFADCDGLETLVLSEGLERIGNRAFAGCTALTRVVLPKSLQTIGNEAFAECESLTEVVFGNVRTNVQDDAFDGCPYELENLQDEGASSADNFELKVDKKNQAKITAYTGDEEIVVIPGTIAGHPVISLEKGSFKGNQTVREVYISDHIAAVNGDVFRDCVNLEKVHLPEGVKALTATVFAGCKSLREVNIPDSMTEIQRSLFKDAPLRRIYIGRGVERISPDAFCKGEADFATGIYFKEQSLEDIVIDAGNEHFRTEGTMLLSADGKTLFAELGDPVKAVVPEGVEEIGRQAYDRLSSLTEIELPSTLRRIGEQAFAGTNLREVELPPALETIDTKAFSFCRSLTALDINENLRVIGAQAFEGCPIREVYIPSGVESIGNDSFLGISTYQGEAGQRFRVDTANEHLRADGIALYHKTADGVTLLKAYAPELRRKPNEEPVPMEYAVAAGTTEIAPHAFARCNNLSAVTIPEGVKAIGDMAFWDCALLAQAHLPESCETVSPKAFFGSPTQMI